MKKTSRKRASKKVQPKTEVPLFPFVALGVLFAGVILLFGSAHSRLVTEEWISLVSEPSAKKAYEYGSHHFNAMEPETYNIKTAAHFFKAGRFIDNSYPFIRHQQARIEFLKGNYDQALTLIDEEIAINPAPSPSSYYVRGLIKGFRGEYYDAAPDYKMYLWTDPNNWAAINDYAWVLTKDGQYAEALEAIDVGLKAWPANPWLLNSRAAVLYELNRYEEAYSYALMANTSVQDVRDVDWLKAYPGNDPRVAADGVAAFKKAVAENMHMISLARSGGEKNVQ